MQCCGWDSYYCCLANNYSTLVCQGNSGRFTEDAGKASCQKEPLTVEILEAIVRDAERSQVV